MDLLETIKNRSNIVDVVQERLNIVRKGKVIKALCPFHDDKTPSLIVSESKQIFKCFSCGMGGDIVTFLMEYDKINFKEALKQLATRYGINLPRTFNLKNTEHIDPYLREKTINQMATDVYHRYLLKGKGAAPAREYLIKRNINKKALTMFKIGYAARKKDFLTKIILEKKSFEKVLKTNLIKKDYGEVVRDFFNHRIIFPIINEKNETLGFGGRSLDDEQVPKYINSAEGPWFKKREILYGFRESYQMMLKKQTVYVVEGYFDVLAFYSLGLPTVAPMGTSLTKEQLLKLKRYVNKIHLVMDNDRAGIEANLKAIAILMELEINAYVITLKPKQDPFDLATNLEEAEVHRYLNDYQKPIYEYLLEYYTPPKGASPIEKKQNFVKVVSYYRLIKDEYLKKNFDDMIKEHFQISAEEYNLKTSTHQKHLAPKRNTSHLMSTKERELVAFLCFHPSYIKSTSSIFSTEDFLDDFAKHIYKKLLYNNSASFKKIENILKLFSKPQEKAIVDFIIGETIKNDHNQKAKSSVAIIEEEFKDRVSLLKLEHLKRKKNIVNESILKSIKLNEREKIIQLDEEKLTLIKEQNKLKNFVNSFSNSNKKNN